MDKEFIILVVVSVLIVAIVPSPWDWIAFATLVIVRIAMFVVARTKGNNQNGQQ